VWLQVSKWQKPGSRHYQCRTEGRQGFAVRLAFVPAGLVTLGTLFHLGLNFLICRNDKCIHFPRLKEKAFNRVSDIQEVLKWQLLSFLLGKCWSINNCVNQDANVYCSSNECTKVDSQAMGDLELLCTLDLRAVLFPGHKPFAFLAGTEPPPLWPWGFCVLCLGIYMQVEAFPGAQACNGWERCLWECLCKSWEFVCFLQMMA
jgi:hypothetical protein